MEAVARIEGESGITTMMNVASIGDFAARVSDFVANGSGFMTIHPKGPVNGPTKHLGVGEENVIHQRPAKPKIVNVEGLHKQVYNSHMDGKIVRITLPKPPRTAKKK